MAVHDRIARKTDPDALRRVALIVPTDQHPTDAESVPTRTSVRETLDQRGHGSTSNSARDEYHNGSRRVGRDDERWTRSGREARHAGTPLEHVSFSVGSD
ncbi:hypothetical protein GCM10007298_25700 [Williamsia phyllosphaerae]|uniref:Uncharacterized protein n=1 Tax=Williamsia phyllosphaerae TaxID=885042 RepID=A0ABQ1UYV8_9NOCA|nr:hypothetical protein GCM10007298_25700 [Williamsia phyllosphaerae]